MTATETKIEKRTISSQVFDILSEKIVSGEWPKGYRLPGELEIANELGVSRASVRAALQKMQAYGMVETKAGDGTVVAHISMRNFLGQLYEMSALPNDYIQQNQMKLILEQIAKEIIILNGGLSKEEGGQLREMAQNIRRLLKEGNIAEYQKVDNSFHRQLIVSSKNEILIMIYDAIASVLNQVAEENTRRMEIVYGSKYADVVGDIHDGFIDALENGDKEAVMNQFYSSLENTKRIQEAIGNLNTEHK